MTDLTYAATALSDAVPDAIVTKVTRQLLGDRRDVLEFVPGRAGSWRFGEQPGDRLILVTLNIATEGGLSAANTARRAAVVALADWADQHSAQMVIDDQDDRYWIATLDTAPTPDEWMQSADIELEFRASPYAFDIDLSTETLELEDAAPETLTIPDEVEAYPVLEITAGEDMPSGFSLLVNGLELLYGTEIETGDVITVSSVSYTVSLGANTDTGLDGTFDPDTLSMLLLDGDFPILNPGPNTVALEGGDSTVVVTWRRRYR